MAMLSISLSVYSPPSTAAPLSPTTTSPLAGGTRQFICKPPPSLALTSPHDLRRRTGVASGRRRVQIVSMAPTPQRITRRSPQDFPAVSHSTPALCHLGVNKGRSLDSSTPFVPALWSSTETCNKLLAWLFGIRLNAPILRKNTLEIHKWDSRSLAANGNFWPLEAIGRVHGTQRREDDLPFKQFPCSTLGLSLTHRLFGRTLLRSIGGILVPRWPRPGRRPDLLPQFSPMKTPLPPPMPFDPPFEEGEEEEEEELEQVEQPMQEDDGEETEQPDGAGLA
ncbi:hypothetical protein Acr_11g0013380 [Actinidia rufa]|uniref:Uncharacterized protein n=1 Tax=Actinidia rufa TaxID=165716 RepID=A0A7J0FEA1_9ERIC|nr:hypothetical protein Acr_11g0013380 [Actinidia rufa]